MRALALSLVILALSGCGYRAIRGEGTGPAPVVQVGTIEDFSPEGDLGATAHRALVLALSGRRADRQAPVISGQVRLLPERPAGFDAEGRAVIYAVGVELTLSLDDGQRALWHSGRIQRSAPYVRASTPLESLTARRVALKRATEQAVQAALARLRAAPLTEETP